MSISQKEGYFENPWYSFLGETLLFLLVLKQNLQEKAFSSDKTKTKPTFAVELLIFTVCLMNHIFQTSYSLIHDNRMYRT